MSFPQFRLHRDTQGRLVYTAGTVTAEGVIPVRAFPISEPELGLSLVDATGHELVWVERLADLPAAERALIEEELTGREFMPEILRIVAVTGYATPSSWTVRTDRGETTFVLRGEEDIRRLGAKALLVADSHGIHYLIRDIQALDNASRQFLDRFL
jgi:hypothetical protein